MEVRWFEMNLTAGVPPAGGVSDGFLGVNSKDGAEERPLRGANGVSGLLTLVACG